MAGARKPLLFPFRNRWRRVVYVAIYETIAILLVTLALTLDNNDAGAATFTAVGSSTIAVIWNWVYNTLFEHWEARQAVRGRSPLRRTLHGIGFEGGLIFLLSPFMAWALHTSLIHAFTLNIGLLVFFLIYTIGFTWVFDRLFGLPASAS